MACYLYLGLVFLRAPQLVLRSDPSATLWHHVLPYLFSWTILPTSTLCYTQPILIYTGSGVNCYHRYLLLIMLLTAVLIAVHHICRLVVYTRTSGHRSCVVR